MTKQSIEHETLPTNQNVRHSFEKKSPLYNQIRAKKAKEKIIYLNHQNQKFKESKSSNAKKLINKHIKIQTEQKSEHEIKTFNQRYFHISIDKLADAFEKQFL